MTAFLKGYAFLFAFFLFILEIKFNSEWNVFFLKLIIFKLFKIKFSAFSISTIQTIQLNFQWYKEMYVYHFLDG